MTTGTVLCANCSMSRELLERPLAHLGLRLVTRPQGEALLEDVLSLQPDVILYELRPDTSDDLGLLHLLRRLVPDVPLVLIADDESLATQRLVRELRPIYYAVQPVDTEEILDAVRAAVAQHARKAAH